MASPTLTYGGTTVTLPMPAAGKPTRSIDERSIARRTLAGYLRTTVLSRDYTYVLPFTAAPKATYDALAALWAAALAGGSYPTFQWTGGPWDTALAPVPVSVAIGPAGSEYADATLYAFTLTLTEASPR